MSTPAGMAQSPSQWPTQQNQGPPPDTNNDGDDDGVSIRPMRLKVLYTFDDQNKTNCLARGEDVLQIKTVAMDETTSIGILDLKTCIETVTRCSPELISRVGQDYTVYAYDYSEYDNPLVGQGMLSRVLASASPQIAPAQQSQKLITGRVCKNILGLFNNGVKETLEVKLRLVPVPTAMQGEYVNTMERYREISGGTPAGFDHNEWTKFLQSNPNMTQMANNFGAPASTASSHRGSMNMEVVNQLLSPNPPQQQNPQDPFGQVVNLDSGNESRGGTNSGKGKKTSRPSSRTSVKRPRAKRQPKAAATKGGNTSGYEEGTDGDDGPAPRKRAKITQTDWKNKSSFGAPTDSLRVAASTAGSLRMFRPIAMSPGPGLIAGSHLQEIPRAPTPVPILPNQYMAREPSQSGLRHDSLASQAEAPRKHISPFPALVPLEDQIRDSIESANPSPERNYSPVATPPDIGSSPPIMRNVSTIRSSPPVPSSPVLPEMPRTDSGFMSGTLDELFGDDDEEFDDDYVDVAPYLDRRRVAREEKKFGAPRKFVIEEEMPGPMELLPTTMAVFKRPPRVVTKGIRSRAASVLSEDGQTLPPLKPCAQPSSRHPSPIHIVVENSTVQLNTPQMLALDPSEAIPTALQAVPQPVAQPVAQPSPPQDSVIPPPAAATQSRRGSKMLVRTASMGSLSLPAIPASDPVLPPSTLQRSQTWTETPHPAAEGPLVMPLTAPMLSQASLPPYAASNNVPYNRTLTAKKASIRQKLEAAIAKGEMPPFCGNCGTIETATWRKAWSQEHQGEPGYYEYSDNPGHVTAINVLARDAEGRPTLYQLIKKKLGENENQSDWQQFTLCNPCGIWLSKYKSHRPEASWECNTGRLDTRKRSTSKPPGAKKPARPRSKKNQSIAEVHFTSDANIPQSDMYYPQSEAYYPRSDAFGPPEGVSPSDTTGGLQPLDIHVQRVELPADQPQASRPSKRGPMTSDAASAALRRAIQSSPARWAGTQHSPIDVEDVGSARRLLFPSPRKDGSPKVLGEVDTNIVHIDTDAKSPKVQTADAVNKENCPPTLHANDADAELLAMFEEEMARPTTPVQNAAPTNLFKTPTRPTPNHRPVTRSVSRSMRSIRSAKSPGQLLMFAQHTPSKTPSSSARRQSPRNHQTVFESPFTASLNQLFSEANNPSSPSRHFNMDLDFGNLPDLPMIDCHNQGDLNFNINDFFSTDMPMPSSPPKMFHLYEDPAAMANIDWNEFSQYNDDQHLSNVTNQDQATVEIKKEPQEDVEGLVEEPKKAIGPEPVQELQPQEAPLGQSNSADQQSQPQPKVLGTTAEGPIVALPEPSENTIEHTTQNPTEEDKDDEVDMVGMND